MRTHRRLFAAAAVLGLAACGREEARIVDGAGCYPAAARRWVSAPPEARAGGRDPGGPYAVYIDGSASMVGYLRGATASERTLADLVGMLPNLPGIAAGPTELVRFDRKIRTVPAAELARLQTEAGYLCPAAAPDCDAQESHVDQALGRIAAGPKDGLAVVVSDLWLTNSEIRTTGGVALSRPLADILASGRGVAVYGFDSPYAGRVYDMPSGSAAVSARRRYLFMVAVGPPARLDALHAAMLRAPSAAIARDLASGRARHALFTTAPVLHAPDGAQAFDAPPAGPLRRTAFLPVRQGVRIPQFAVERAKALRAEGGAAAWRGIAADDLRPGAVWTGPGRGTAELFRMAGEACLPNGGDWRPEGAWRTGWRNDGFTLDPADIAALPRGRYLLLGRLHRTGLETPNPAAAWMREWSFDAAGERAAGARATMPTLNLGETARLLENALAQAAEARPMEVGGFAVAVRVD